MKLTFVQVKILETLKKSDLAQKFYWTGGTLLSYHYLHHRLSFDLDFFTKKPFTYDELVPFLKAVKHTLGTVQLEETKIYDRWEFVVPNTKLASRFEFVYYNGDKKRLAPLVDYKGVLIDSLPDLAANKVMAYFDRNQPKDLFDVYTLLSQKKFSVRELLDLVEEKFGARLDEFLFWTESTKSFKQLPRLLPYLPQKEKNKKDILEKVRNFFLEGGRAFLSRQLKSDN